MSSHGCLKMSGFVFKVLLSLLEALVLLRSITLKIIVKFQSQSEAFLINVFGKQATTEVFVKAVYYIMCVTPYNSPSALNVICKLSFL